VQRVVRFIKIAVLNINMKRLFSRRLTVKNISQAWPCALRQVTSNASLPDGPSLKHFLKSDSTHNEHIAVDKSDAIPYIAPEDLKANGRKGMLAFDYAHPRDKVFSGCTKILYSASPLLLILLCFSVH